jgi:REP-associated tyrosine transposase
MGRAPRIQFPDAVYHVWTNGNRDCEIFKDVDDREIHLGFIDDGVREDGWICHAYCQMTTHYHLVVQTPEANLDRVMHRLNSAYAHWFNRRHGYSGHLFKQRYDAEAVLTEPYALEVARYVALNPVRARICRRAEEWPWSSYRANVGLAKAPAFLDNDWVVSLFGNGVPEGRRRFRQFVEEAVSTGARHE